MTDGIILRLVPSSVRSSTAENTQYCALANSLTSEGFNFLKLGFKVDFINSTMAIFPSEESFVKTRSVCRAGPATTTNESSYQTIKHANIKSKDIKNRTEQEKTEPYRSNVIILQQQSSNSSQPSDIGTSSQVVSSTFFNGNWRKCVALCSVTVWSDSRERSSTAGCRSDNIRRRRKCSSRGGGITRWDEIRS
ncbi:hypothetical protein WICPIJ_000258 [Wickerhamomyces pijperi]|uniref:Uncharacterized protein n=1 Tax=Wickerhamomyces pijperi TaxID=599730 RepID=A0A9P8QE88_WICPI|nr:hypothetical protein WICPIJ_000258 [Wickerhamomyces pijperi]